MYGLGIMVAAWAMLVAPGAPEGSGPDGEVTRGGPAVASSITEQRCTQEVLELHLFLQEWFNGRLPPSDEAFSRFSTVMAASFVLISPDGTLTRRDELNKRLREAHGIWRRTGLPGKIWIDNLQVRHQVGDQAMVLYEEWQEVEGEVRGRVSTALFGRRAGAPNGVEWLHLHEVWLPE